MQRNSTVKFPASSLRLQTKEHVLTVNKSEITGKNAFNEDIFEIQGNHESIKDEKTWF